MRKTERGKERERGSEREIKEDFSQAKSFAVSYTPSRRFLYILNRISLLPIKKVPVYIE